MAKKEEISDKNTKAQILEVYHAALDQIKQKQAEQRSFVERSSCGVGKRVSKKERLLRKLRMEPSQTYRFPAPFLTFLQ